MKQNWGLDWSEYIGYEGGGPLSSAVLSGEIDAGIILATPIIDFVEQGDLEVVMTVGSESPSQFSEEVDTPDQFDLDATSVRAAGGELVLSVWGPPALTDQEQSTLESDFIDMMNSDPIQDWSEESGQTVEPESGSVVEETVQESFNLEEDYLEFQDSISG
jgi:tripartite-type tricarboxylate transporter receptor subunit TctC